MPPTRHHRWVLEEPTIDASMSILYEDERIIVADKPHGLATTPRGMWYKQTALMKIRDMYQDENIVPAHRLDRMTAGVVVFVRQKEVRGAYQMLFQEHKTTKVYECLAPCAPVRSPLVGSVEFLNKPQVFPLIRRSRIIKERGFMQAFEVCGEANSQTLITAPDDEAVYGIQYSRRGFPHVAYRTYRLYPLTGKTHQLRLHMSAIGLPIAGDDFYPVITQRHPQDLDHPLQLVARTLSFTDPIDGTYREYVSQIPLSW
ncbi:MAG: pseudouridine synthase [Bifidobacteriaceae bacterium]|nr:pseudouridine synthase [Bifidobacteriaceae bacterium]